MVLDDEERRLDLNYLDFISLTLTTGSCLFLDCHFLDPAIGHVLDMRRRSVPHIRDFNAATVPSSRRRVS